jgi:arginyl-tRNA synthetase
MKSIAGQLNVLFSRALERTLGEAGRGVDPMIRVSGEERFGDYQSNAAMGLAKRLGRKPREIAQQLVDALTADPEVAAMCEPFEIAGPGFINIRLTTEWMAATLNGIPAGDGQDRLGIEPTPEPETVVVDYSGPNIAKQMHVGHLRSTVIGDTIARILEFEGHRVIRQNHIGDWGTQFGMLIAYLDIRQRMDEADEEGNQTLDESSLEDIEGFYKDANVFFGLNPDLRPEISRQLNLLHHGDPHTRELWQTIVASSRQHYETIYRRLGVSLTRADERGESFYAERLPRVTEELQDFGQSFNREADSRHFRSGPCQMSVEMSDGALCVFHETASGGPVFKNPEGKRIPMIIRKSDGAYLYATTDLAALQYRIRELHADRIIYVTDARQAQHFEMVFATVRGAGWTRPAGKTREVELDHVTFGSILGPDRKPLKTRSGENVKLAELLDEAVSRAESLIRANEADPAKKRGFSEEEIHDIAEAVGIGAVKYADLSQNRQSDYVFSWDKMLAMEGNTAPYMMYAYARIRSIYRKGAEENQALTAGRVQLTEPAERMLARQILRLAETLEGVAVGLKLNLLTEYLFMLAGAFMSFYEACPVLKADTEEQRASRLRLCDLTARALRIGLDLLGIRVVERM